MRSHARLEQPWSKPYLNPDGTLVIPMLADAKYHWWKQGGQTVRKTMEELRVACRQDGR